MGHDISRRDFINGVALTVASALTPFEQLAAQALRRGPYPPALTGLRGSTDEAYAVVHAVAREGRTYDVDKSRARGALRSRRDRRGACRIDCRLGLSRPAAESAHPDPRQPRRLRRSRAALRVSCRQPAAVSYGGSEIDGGAKRQVCGRAGPHPGRSAHLPGALRARERVSPPPLSRARAVAVGVLRPRDLRRGPSGHRRSAAARLRRVRTQQSRRACRHDAFLADCPLPPEARRGLSELFAGTRDYLAGQSAEEKIAALAKTSYRAFLTDICRLPAKAADFFQGRSTDNYGYGIDAIGAIDAMASGFPGRPGTADRGPGRRAR